MEDELRSSTSTTPPETSRLEASLKKPNNNFHPELDFMRATAVLMVVFDHTAIALHHRSLAGLSFGWLGLVGVWIFFVHTTLVLMWSLERKPYTLDFYVRRAFRIYPLVIVAIVIATLTHAPLTGTVDNFFQFHSITPGNFLAAATLLFNLVPDRLNYHPIVNVVWSLPLEVDMYLLLPGLFLLASRVRAKWPILLLWVFACAVDIKCHFDFQMVFISAIPYFLPGVVAYIGYRSRRPSVPAWLFPPFLFGASALVLLAPSIPKGWIFAMALGLALPYFRPFGRSVLTRASHEIAKYSYGIYLSHPFGLAIGFYLLRGRPFALQLSVEIATIAITSLVTYHLLEAPMIRMGAAVAARLEQRALTGRALLPDHPLV